MNPEVSGALVCCHHWRGLSLLTIHLLQGSWCFEQPQKGVIWWGPAVASFLLTFTIIDIMRGAFTHPENHYWVSLNLGIACGSMLAWWSTLLVCTFF